MTMIEALKPVYESLVRRNVGQAMMEMENYLAAWPQQQTADRLSELKADYERMTDYWRQGFKDPQLGKLYEQLLHRMYVLLANINWFRTMQQSSFATQKSAHVRQIRRDWSTGAIRQEMENFVSSLAMLDLEPENKRAELRHALYKEHQQHMNDLFDYIWTSRQWTDGVAKAFEEILLTPTVDTIDQQLLVSAITLSVMTTFDMAKFRLLLNVYQHSKNEHVRQRALVGWVLTERPTASAIYPEMQALVADLLQDEAVCQEMTELQIQIVYCLNAERDTQKIQTEIMPDLLKNNTFRITRTGVEEVEEDPMEDILHPEASEQRMEKLEESFQKMMDMQRQGSDIYFGGFSQMKRFPFFYDMSNWLTPFYIDHPDIHTMVEKMRGNKFIRKMLEVGPFCNSDKYSFVIAFQQVMERLPENMREMLNRGEATMGEVAREELHTTAYIRRAYLMDLYRFFRLYPNRAFLVNPFDDYCFFFGRFYQHTPLKKRNDEIVRLLMKQQMTERASMLLGTYDKAQQNTPYYILVGKLLQQYPQYSAHYAERLTPVLCYQRALEQEPDNERALLGYARSVFSEGDYQEALAAYEKLLTLNPERKSYQLNKAVCLTNIGAYAEALPLLYRLNYDYPDDENVSRVLAWTQTCDGKLEQAERLYQQLLSVEPPSAYDRLNYGYCLWFMGRIDMAVEQFRTYIEQAQPANKDIFDEEKALLEQKGISDVEQKMMLSLL